MTGCTDTQPSRRQVLKAGAAGVTAALAGTSLLTLETFSAGSASSLRQLAAAKGILFGASLAVHELDRPHGARYAEIYKRDAGLITSELEFKMSSLRPSADRLEFSHADRLVDFALHNQMSVRGHTLIWNDDLPAWIKRLGSGEIEQLIETHLMSVLERYRGKVDFWDVVNEPIAPWDKKPGNLRDGPFYSALGEGYIERAFKLARQYAPAAKLVLNEAQTETDDANGEVFRSSLLSLVKRLKDQGAPIDAIGLQSHLKTAAPYDFAKFADFIRSLAALGFEIHITELDVNDTGAGGPISARDATVADLYGRFLSAVLQVPAVKVVQTWQIADGTSWMRDPVTSSRMGVRAKARPLLYDEAFRKKPAWDAVARAFEAAPAR